MHDSVPLQYPNQTPRWDSRKDSNKCISYRQVKVVSVNLEGIDERQEASPVPKGQHNSLIISLEEAVEVSKHLVRGHGGDLKSWASLVMKLEVLLKLKECCVNFWEEVTPGREISNFIGSVSVSFEWKKLYCILLRKKAGSLLELPFWLPGKLVFAHIQSQTGQFWGHLRNFLGLKGLVCLL